MQGNQKKKTMCMVIAGVLGSAAVIGACVVGFLNRNSSSPETHGMLPHADGCLMRSERKYLSKLMTVAHSRKLMWVPTPDSTLLTPRVARKMGLLLKTKDVCALLLLDWHVLHPWNANMQEDLAWNLNWHREVLISHTEVLNSHRLEVPI